MNKEEKLRRRNISREYIKMVEEKKSLEEHPECDSNDYICDSCKRQKLGCGVTLFTPYVDENLHCTDNFRCEGYI
jgi:hypothetical protein